MEINKLDKEYRWGLMLRKKIRIFCRTYGKGIWFSLRRKIVVFLDTLLDLEHQETYTHNPHYRYWQTYANSNEKRYVDNREKTIK